MRPYIEPIISWATGPQHGVDEYVLTITGSGDAAGFADPNPLVLAWDASVPVFPFLAPVLENLLQTTGDDLNATNWRVRWVFGSASPWTAQTWTGARAHEPKLSVFADDDEGYVSGSLQIAISSPNTLLTPDYMERVGSNWLGAFGSTFTSTFPLAAEVALPLPLPPAGVFCPQVLQYGDNRSLARSVGQATNPFSHRKRVSQWGTRYERGLTFPLVSAKNLYGYRRIDPAFEEDSVRQQSPNNLYEFMAASTVHDLDYYVWTKVPDAEVLDSVAYYGEFRGRVVKILGGDVVADDAQGRSYQEDDFRLANIAIASQEPSTTPSPFVVGPYTIPVGVAT